MEALSDKFLLIGGATIVAAGVLSAIANNRPISRIAFGGTLFVVILAVVAMFGPVAAAVARGLVAIALLAVLLNEVPAVIAAYKP